MRPAALSIDSSKSKKATLDRGFSAFVVVLQGVVKRRLLCGLLVLMAESTWWKEEAERLTTKKSSTYLARKMMSDHIGGNGVAVFSAGCIQGRPKSRHTGRMADHT
jgi:hypothetical protein